MFLESETLGYEEDRDAYYSDSVQNMEKAAPITFAAKLTRMTQSVTCYAMCDELGW